MGVENKKNEKHYPWVLLRGLAREKGHWPPEFHAQMEKAFPGSALLFIDLPGMGDEREKRSPRQIELILDFVRTKLRICLEGLPSENKSKVNLLALSLGAMVGMSWMETYPEELQSAVFVNTSMSGLLPFYRRLRPHAMISLLATFLIRNPEERESQILAVISQRKGARDSLSQRWGELAEKRPVHFMNILNQLYAASNFRMNSTMPLVPTLLLTGQRDQLVDPECSEVLHRRYGWEIARHPWAGHDLAIDDAPWLIEQVKLWAARRSLV